MICILVAGSLWLEAQRNDKQIYIPVSKISAIEWDGGRTLIHTDNSSHVIGGHDGTLDEVIQALHNCPKQLRK